MGGERSRLIEDRKAFGEVEMGWEYVPKHKRYGTGAALFVPNERSAVLRDGVCDRRRPVLPSEQGGAADERGLLGVAYPLLRSRDCIGAGLSTLEQYRLPRSEGIEMVVNWLMSSDEFFPLCVLRTSRHHFLPIYYSTNYSQFG